MDVINNWFSRQQKSNVPEPTALQALRCKQIEQLRSIDGRVVELQRDQEYCVTVDDKSGLSIIITLPPQFPQERPIVRVTQKVIHPWINDQMLVVGCPGVNSFMVHSDLGKVIREIVDEFRHNPPMSRVSSHDSSTPSIWSMPSSSALTSSFLSRNQIPSHQIQKDTHVRPMNGTSDMKLSELDSFHLLNLPVISSVINDLSLNECESLSNDDEKIMELLNSVPLLQKAASDRRHLQDQLEHIAKENINKKTVLEERKRLILEKYDQLNELRNKFDANSKKQDELLEIFSPQMLQDNMKLAALEAEEAAEEIADQFLDGKITIDEFNKTFMPQRMLSHLRRVKEEKCFPQNVWKY